MHFSNDRMREIERCNQILLKKILNQGPSHSQMSSVRVGQTKSTVRDHFEMPLSVLNTN